MKRLLAKDNIALLAQLAGTRVLLAFDFDGTLAPIVEKRDDAEMSANTRRLFRAVCASYSCAVISGRSCADVSTRLAGANVKYVVGNHGLEPGEPADLLAFEREVQEARVHLAQELAALPRVDIEDKRYSLAVHYRGSQERVHAAISAAIAALPGRMRTVPGKRVLNVIPARAADKGSALLKLRDLDKADTALFVGDDVTDEDVFKLEQTGRLLAVKVGQSRSSKARYFLRNQSEIDDLLSKLLELREGQGVSGIRA